MEEAKKPRKPLTPMEAKRKAESYCAYQERAQQEVRNKLYEWGLYKEEVENIIAQLIEDNFLNEERFATAYTLGKFRMKGWGKIKIKQHLKAKHVSEPLIRSALNKITEEEYLEKIEKTAKNKVKKQISSISFAEKSKLYNFLQSKGFENDIIFKIINKK